MKRPEDPCRDPASEARDDWADALADGIGCRPLAPLRPDPNNLEGPGPTDEERRANARALSKLTVQERLELMFRGVQP
jgi:hypothetical protein